MKEISGFNGYFVTEDGDVFSSKSGTLRKLKEFINIDGYRVFTLYGANDGRRRIHVRASRLVAMAYINNPDPEVCTVVNHIDHVKTNDHISNLEWVSVSENTKLSVAFQPEKHKSRAVICDDTAHTICDMIQDGYRNCDISTTIGVAIDIVKHIRAGKTWTEVSCHYKLLPSTRCGVSIDTARWVWEKTKDGLPPSKILKISTNASLTANTIKKIKNGTLYPQLRSEYINK